MKAIDIFNKLPNELSTLDTQIGTGIRNIQYWFRKNE